MENKKNTATNNPEMVTISREEYESQQAQLTELKLQNQWLLEQLGLAKKRQFGKSSERLQEGLMDQLVLMANEAEAYAYGTKNATEEQVKVKAHARKRQSGNVLDIVPEGTPTEVVEHRLSEEERICDACGSVMEEIGKEVRRSLKMEPARLAVRVGDRGRKSAENTQKAHILPWQFCLSGGSGPHYDPEICHVLAAVPSGAGVSEAGPEAVPADHGQLDPAGLGHLAAACV